MSKPALASLTDYLRSNRTFVVCVLLAAATLVVYGRVVRFDFADYDDTYFIYRNPMVCSGLTLRGLLWALGTNYFDFWHPVTWWSHMLDCQLFGLAPGWHHLVSAVLHLANTLLLYGLLQRMTGAWKRSALVAALFAVHPMHVESVAWLAERKDVLSTFFFLLCIWFYVSFVKAAETRPGQTRRHFRLALLFFALALMSKAMVVTLPFVLLLLDYWPLGRAPAPASRVPGGEGNAAKLSTRGASLATLWNLICEKRLFFGLSFASCLITYLGMKAHQNVFSSGQVTWSFRLANTAVSYARYLAKLIWPSGLCAYYPSPGHWPFWQVAGAVLVLVLISVVAIGRMRSAPYLIWGWLLFLGTLLPVIGIVAMSHQSIADRYTYIPSIGVFVAGVWAVADLSRRWNWRPALGWATVAVVLALYGWVAWGQTGYWRNGITIWTRCLAVTPPNAVAHFGLGVALMDSGRMDEATAQYRQVLSLQPDHPEANMNLGVLCLHRGRFEEATNYFARTLQVLPQYGKAHRNMGNALHELKCFTEASNHYAQALLIDPNDPLTHRHYARTLVALGDFTGALAHSQQAIRFNTNDSLAYIMEGEALTGLGRSDEALNCYVTALTFDSANAQAHYDLGLEWLKRNNFDQALEEFNEVLRLDQDLDGARSEVALARQGKARAAVGQCRRALRLNPDAPAALNNLAWILATCPEADLRNGPEAVPLAERACQATAFQQPTLIGTLAAAYAEAGRFDEAVQTAQKASDVALSLGQTNLSNRNQELRQQYQRRQAYHPQD
jgi:tetratricopeptide (TPR) repeat protein